MLSTCTLLFTSTAQGIWKLSVIQSSNQQRAFSSNIQYSCSLYRNCLRSKTALATSLFGLLTARLERPTGRLATHGCNFALDKVTMSATHFHGHYEGGRCEGHVSFRTYLLVGVHAREALLAGAAALVGRGLVASAAAGFAALGSDLLHLVLGSVVGMLVSAYICSG